MRSTGHLTVDRCSDLHTHSDVTDGTDSPDDMADAALAAGLRVWGLSDHIRADTTWLPEYATRIRGLSRPEMVIRCGVEAKISTPPAGDAVTGESSSREVQGAQDDDDG